MHRRKITSVNQLKAERQLKRAIKRGDAPPPDPTAVKDPKRSRRKKGAPYRHGSEAHSQAIESSRKLQSAFIRLPPTFLEDTKHLASTLPLPRPIPPQALLLSSDQIGGEDRNLLAQLTCPSRPKWRFDMSKLEVEKNEEGLFKKWIEKMDQVVDNWQKGPEIEKEGEGEETENVTGPGDGTTTMPRSPTYYERNLEVWRQLWRVVEISQIILVLLDSRCPLLHFPPSLSAYLANHKIILVLTKVDICGPVRAAAWTRYLNEHFPDRPVVQVEAYAEKAIGVQSQGRAFYEPHLPQTFKERLVDAIKGVHAEMLIPPVGIKNDEDKMKQWKPPVKSDIDWDNVLVSRGDQVGSAVSGSGISKPKDAEIETAESGSGAASSIEPEYLTIGLIGQPNVGKSSLLNALFGTNKVRASKTPGKTKHFQTLFWTPDVRLVDCPGLVMPNLVPMEMQVLSGILPISRVSAIPACIHYISQYIPLEKVYGLKHPSSIAEPVEDKRTWRDGMRPSGGAARENPPWSAMDVVTAYADQKGWVTAKAGRPDIGRAGNAILRGVAESGVKWAFWPPDSDLSALDDVEDGIWIGNEADGEHGNEDRDAETESDEGDIKSSSHSEESANSEGVVSEEEEEKLPLPVAGVGRFGALVLAEDDDEEEVQLSAAQ